MAKCNELEGKLDVECNLNTRVINDVFVNPETERHVGIQHKVKDRTTADIGIAIPVTRCELDVSTTECKISDDVINGVGGLSVNHVVN